jgi:hypothetical protein
LATKRRDRQPSITKTQFLGGNGFSGHPVPKAHSDVGCLIDNGPAIDDVDEPAGERRSECSRNEPYRHRCRLPESGRDVERLDLVSSQEAVKELELPGKGVLPIGQAEGAAQPLYAPLIIGLNRLRSLVYPAQLTFPMGGCNLPKQRS